MELNRLVREVVSSFGEKQFALQDVLTVLREHYRVSFVTGEAVQRALCEEFPNLLVCWRREVGAKYYPRKRQEKHQF